MAIDQHDQQMHPRCPPLGGEVPFLHCRQVNGGLPCHRIVTCWHGRLDIALFLRTNYSCEEIEAMSRPPEPRLGVILETLAHVRRREPST